MLDPRVPPRSHFGLCWFCDLAFSPKFWLKALSLRVSCFDGFSLLNALPRGLRVLHAQVWPNCGYPCLRQAALPVAGPKFTAPLRALLSRCHLLLFLLLPPPQPQASDLSGHCRTSTRYNLSQDMAERMPKKNVYQNMCQILCHSECQNVCQSKCHILCHIDCQKLCQIDRQNTCQAEWHATFPNVRTHVCLWGLRGGRSSRLVVWKIVRMPKSKEGITVVKQLEN